MGCDREQQGMGMDTPEDKKSLVVVVVVVVVGGGESDYSVCPRPLLQFLQFFQFMSDRLRQLAQITSGYVSLRWRDRTWSSTIQ